jgi:photosystem II stability/assembly factor-like uncharacterized protein
VLDLQIGGWEDTSMAGNYTICVGTIGSGLWLSPDGGDSWQRVRDGLSNESRVFGLTVHPTEKRTVFAGADDGIYLSRDGGRSFARLDSPMNAMDVWRIAIDPTNPDVMFAGTRPAALFRSTDAGQSWHELPGLREVKGNLWQPGAGGMCLHTIVLDPNNPDRIVVAISAAGAFRTDDGGQTWLPINQGLKSPYELPDPDADVGHCVHNVAMHPSRPDVLFMQKHWDVMRSDNAGECWHEVSGNLPSDFGFPIAVHAHEPETIYVVPIKSDSEHFPPEGKLRVYRSRTGGNEWEALTDGLPQRDCYVNVLRDAMAVDSLHSCGIYVGTTGGQVYASANSGDTWTPIVHDLPSVLSVEVQTLQ